MTGPQGEQGPPRPRRSMRRRRLRARAARLQPLKLFFPELGLTKLDLVNYYIECAAGGRPPPARAPDRDEALGRRRGGRAVLPEARARTPRRSGSRRRPSPSPAGAHARELVPDDAAHLVWGVNLGVIDWNPWPVRRSDLDHPDELRVDLDPGPGCVRRGAPRRALRGRGARRARLARLPQDLRLARHPRLRADPARARLHRGAPRRACARP